jgi:glycine hydroxymethyltransferase
MALTLKNPESEAVHKEARQRVARLTEKYPLYPQLRI